MSDDSSLPHIVQATGHANAQRFGVAVAWVYYGFAQPWFEDALHEARITSDYHGRRREILFAVCAAESYLFEWVRDRALNGNFRELVAYFPAEHRRGVRANWREIPKRLVADGRICGAPDLSGVSWRDFGRLVDFRDGLVHAKGSRPVTSFTPPAERPFPTNEDLSKLDAGWPTRVAAATMRELSIAAGFDPPEWLVDP